jgi:hypothetical protein
MSPRRKLNTPGGALLRIQILFNYFQIMLIEALSDRDKQTTPPHTTLLMQPLNPNQMNKERSQLWAVTLGKERLWETHLDFTSHKNTNWPDLWVYNQCP